VEGLLAGVTFWCATLFSYYNEDCCMLQTIDKCSFFHCAV